MRSAPHPSPHTQQESQGGASRLTCVHLLAWTSALNHLFPPASATEASTLTQEGRLGVSPSVSPSGHGPRGRPLPGLNREEKEDLSEDQQKAAHQHLLHLQEEEEGQGCSRCRLGRLGSETGAAPRVFGVGPLAARRGAVLLGGRSWEPRKKLEPRPLSPPSPLAPSPIPERSPRSLAACEARGQRGRAAGGGAAARVGSGPGGRRGVVFGDGEGADRERPRAQPHPAGSPGAGHPGRTPCSLPPGSARCLRKPRWDSDSRGLDRTL